MFASQKGSFGPAVPLVIGAEQVDPSARTGDSDHKVVTANSRSLLLENMFGEKREKKGFGMTLQTLEVE